MQKWNIDFGIYTNTNISTVRYEYDRVYILEHRLVLAYTAKSQILSDISLLQMLQINSAIGLYN